jgi:hypothetical protein
LLVATPCWPAPVSAITRFCHPLNQKPLPHNIVCLMCACMVQVFPFDINPGPSQMACKIFR